jgi:hypothetical protein
MGVAEFGWYKAVSGEEYVQLAGLFVHFSAL